MNIKLKSDIVHFGKLLLHSVKIFYVIYLSYLFSEILKYPRNVSVQDLFEMISKPAISLHNVK